MAKYFPDQLTVSSFEAALKALGIEMQDLSQLAVAVSGGPDSMALAHCLSEWGNQNALQNIY